jgi:glycogen operon protein
VWLCTAEGLRPVNDLLPDRANDWQPDRFQPFCCATPAQLRAALHEGAFEVLHLFAHGTNNGVLLCDNGGGPVEVSTGDLANWCSRAAGGAERILQLAFLQVCNASQTATRGSFGGLAQQLLNPRGGDLAAVVASTYPLDADRCAHAVSEFYRRLASGASPEAALPRDLPECEWPWALLDLWVRPGALQDVGPCDEQQFASPYRGLIAYQESDADVFCGRKDEIETFYRKLGQERGILTLTANSGVGKSSFLNAGVAHRVRTQGLLWEARWRIVTLHPGYEPARALVAALTDPRDPERLPDQPPHDWRPVISQAFDRALAFRRGAEGALLLIIDQFEEVFTLTDDPRQRDAMADVLGQEVQRRGDTFRVVLGVRSDYLMAAAALPGIGRYINEPWLLRAPDPDALREIIIKPAEDYGFRFEGPVEDDARHAPDLVERILTDALTVTRPPGQVDQASPPTPLPLLEMALQRLWSRSLAQDTNVFTHADYDALGGLFGAIATHAEEVYQSLSTTLFEVGTRAQDVARRVLLALVAHGSARQPLPRAELVTRTGDPGAAQKVIDALVGSRLLTIRPGPDSRGEPIVELAHETLITRWGRFSTWLKDEPKIQVTRGFARTPGAEALEGGVNFVLLSRHGTDVRLVLLPLEAGEPLAEIALHPRKNRTGNRWHVLIKGLPAAFRYGWRVDGPSGPGHRFDPNLVLLDPSGRLVSGSVWGEGGSVFSEARGTQRRSVFRRDMYEWRTDSSPLTHLEDSIIYELHVRGFTIHPSSGVLRPGTFAGLIEKIPYLKQLGITAVELMPVFEFEENDCPLRDPSSGKRLVNYWGYNTISFMAPKASYAASGPEHGQLDEFRDMVKAFHAAGIEIILDVVFSHTGEGDERGTTYSYRGLDNELYYMLDGSGRYLNFSGTGNTLNCNHPVVRQMILSYLRFWVGEMRVDGLRFDLASVLRRDETGQVWVNESPVIERLAEDGLLAEVKLIAEPWDAAGLYQLGSFSGGRRWSEWNSRFRDDVRRFWCGDPGTVGRLASRICGSPDIYQESSEHAPYNSINFVTCHDGFTLNDLVSYCTKHNESNGEGGRDGLNENFSWNCGVEGPTPDRAVLELRARQARNLMATLLLSQGVPLILAGDEFLRTQHGNNCAWCQDNETSWLDWRLAKQHADFVRFTRELIWFRRRHPALRRSRFFRGMLEQGGVGLIVQESTAAGVLPSSESPSDTKSDKSATPVLADIQWHGVEPNRPDWGDASRALAFSLDGRFTGREMDCDFYVALNASHETVSFQIPASPTGRRWRRVVDTARPAPDDIVPESEGPVVFAAALYPVAPHSLIVLLSEL